MACESKSTGLEEDRGKVMKIIVIAQRDHSIEREIKQNSIFFNSDRLNQNYYYYRMSSVSVEYSFHKLFELSEEFVVHD